MNYWLMKSEPSTYSFDHLVKDNKTGWNGGDLPPGFSQGEKTGWGKEGAGNAGPSQANQNRGKSGKK